MRSFKTILICFICAFLLAPLPASALDGTYFTVSGHVTDANWNPIPGALVTLYDNDFNRLTTMYTTDSGYFAFEKVCVKTNLFNVRISYTDATGEQHPLPGYYILAHTASGDITLGPNETHYDNYYLPGSQPHITPTPIPTSTPVSTPTPVPVEPVSEGTQALIFAGGYIGGMVTASLACLIIFRRPGIK